MILHYNKEIEKPKTHILLIGVGGYPYLKGGYHATSQTHYTAKSLGQLSSPPVSIEAFYQTAIKFNDQKSWIKPLGSIEILVSVAPEGTSVFKEMDVESATLENIKASYWSWKKRCDENPDNVAIFLFCGHGLEKGEHFLLAEDFGKRPQNPWEGAFAFDTTRRAFFSCKATTQIFFIDACRLVNSDMLETDLLINPIEPPNLRSRDCKYNLTQKAAAANENAYGFKNRPSFYTSALIKALEGNAVDHDSGKWKISTGSLSVKMNNLIRMESFKEGYAQRCISTTGDVTDLIQLHSPPEVTFNISCNPRRALPLAILSCTELETNVTQRRSNEKGIWQIKVKAGICKVDATFDGLFNSTSAHKYVLPPFAEEELMCDYDRR